MSPLDKFSEALSDSIFKRIEKYFSSYSLFNPYFSFLGWLWKWRFPADRMCSYIRLNVRPRDGAIKIYLSELPRYEVWATVTNHSPFELKLEKLRCELIFSGAQIIASCEDYLIVAPHSTKVDIKLTGKLNDNEKRHISETNKPYKSITLYATLNSGFRVFEKYSESLDAFPINLVN